MPYDRDLDVSLFAKAWETEDDRITVSVYSYNQGTKKVQISRETKNAQGELRFGKLGRLTKEEAEGVLPLLQEALTNMD